MAERTAAEWEWLAETYRRAAAWLLEEGGWRVTEYELSGPRPDTIDCRDRFNPRLRTPEELLATRAKGEAGADQARSLADVREA